MNCSLNNRFYIIPSPVFVSEAGSVCSDSKLANKLTEASLNVDPVETTFILPRCFATSKAFAIVNSRVVKSRHNGAETGAVQVPVVCELKRLNNLLLNACFAGKFILFPLFSRAQPLTTPLICFLIGQIQTMLVSCRKTGSTSAIGRILRTLAARKRQGVIDNIRKKNKNKACFSY